MSRKKRIGLFVPLLLVALALTTVVTGANGAEEPAIRIPCPADYPDSEEVGSIRSDEGIDSDECNLVHDINACDEDEFTTMMGQDGS